MTTIDESIRRVRELGNTLDLPIDDKRAIGHVLDEVKRLQRDYDCAIHHLEQAGQDMIDLRAAFKKALSEASSTGDGPAPVMAVGTGPTFPEQRRVG